MKYVKSFLFVTLLFLSATSALAQSTTRIRYVKPTASGMMDGTSWADAMTLQAALDGYMSGDTLYLIGGDYTPTAKDSEGAAVADARDATYVLPNGVALYGGFAGTETGADAAAVLAARETPLIHSTYATTIEGDIGTMRTATEANNGDNIKRLLYLGAGGTATLDGLTVARAFNSASGAAADGGGLRAESGSSVTLRNCRFIGHRSHDGGAIVVKSTTASPATLMVTDCDFEDNEANTGGALRIEAGGRLNATGSRFERNRSILNFAGGGAIIGVGDATLTVTNGTFERNRSAHNGGAIYVDAGGTLTTTGSTFRENSSGETGYSKSGSAIYFHSSTANPSTGTIARCSFFENSGYGSNAGGTVYGNEDCRLYVSNSVFANNIITWGPAVTSFGDGTFINNTVYNNQDRSNGGAVRLHKILSTWVVANNIIYGNRTGHQVVFRPGSTLTMAHNLIEGNSVENGPTRIGMIAPPDAASRIFLSTDPMHEDYLRLIPGNNVGVDAGANNYIDGNAGAYVAAQGTAIKDRTGANRVNNMTVDAGAYEVESEVATLHVADASGNILQSSGNLNFLAAAGGTVTLRVFYAGTDATMGVAIAKTADAGNIVSALTTSVPSSRTDITFTLATNTASSRRTATLTFTLTGVTPAVSLAIPFTQRRGAVAVHVAADGSGTASGLDWANATTLQAALDNYISGDSLFLRAGVYTPTAKNSAGATVTDARDATYILPDGIKIYGGFVGTETEAAGREMSLIYSTNATIIEGDIGTMRTETDKNNGDNVKRLLYLGAGGAATLDGLTVARAYNDANNEAADGAGLRAELGANMTLRNCRFIGHKGRDGSAVFMESDATNLATLSVTDCIFEDNEANTGGGIRIAAGGRLTATGSRFERNRSILSFAGGGAIIGVVGATLRVTNCTFEGNSANNDGGAILVEAGSTLTITGSTFSENTAGDAKSGSAIYLASSNANRSRGTISRSSFFENVALGTSNGTVYVGTGATLEVSSSVFVNNRMGRGSGVYSDGSNGTFINNTVYSNRDRASSSAAVRLGGGSSTWVVANNIIYGNRGEHQLNFGGATNKTMAHNLIQGNSIENGPTRIGPLTAPMFAAELFASLTATDANYLRLIPGNAVGVDAGNNDYIDGDVSVAYTAMQGTAIKDRTGANRVNNTTVDVGAYESAPSTVPFLRVLGMQGELLSTSGNDPLPAAAGTHTLRVVYGGMGVSSVSIAETTDAGNAVNSVTASVPSSPGEVELVLVANATSSEKQVTLTFTLEGVTHDDVVITLTQRRGAVAVHVAADGNGMASGADWANATTLQAALDNSDLVLHGDSLFLRAGVYTPTAKNSAGSTVNDARNATYVLPDGIKIYGGFVGTETEAAGREMSRIHSTNATIIEGDRGTMRTATDKNNGDNIKRLLYLGAGDAATLDGLTVARAFNSASGAAEDGGGLRAESGTNMTLRNCRFIGHRSHDGGAIVVKSTVASPATLTVTDCIFEDNEANTGGGIRIEAGGRLTATGSRFEGNRATFPNCCGGGALMGVGNATLRVTNCTFERNSSARDGGAIFVEAGGTLTATGSTFRENTAPENRLGSAVYLASSNANRSRGTISRCSFFENVALGTSNGTVYASTGATLEVSSSVFVNNRMGSGAGVYSDGSNGTFINNTVYDNRDRASSSAAVRLGGGSSTWVVANNIIYGNTGEHQLNFGGATNKTMAHNLIQGGDDGIENGPTRTGPLTAPMFAAELFASLTATDANYLRLIPGNAIGVDAGNNNYIDGDVSVSYTAMQGMAIKDRTGANRVNNTTVDVGAYESAPSTAPFLRALGAQGELLSTSGNDPLPAAAGTHTLRVVYGGMGASSVSIAETTDAGNAVNSVTASVSSSPGEVELVLVANTTSSEKQVTLTFTLEGATHDDVVITLSQRRGAVAIHVAADGNEAASGADWANATTLQAALDNRDLVLHGDSLFLRAGVYTPTAKNSAGATVTDARDATYVLPDGIKIYGGFVGTETEAAGREMSLIHSTNATIIEGDRGTMRTATDKNNGDNVKRLLYLGAGDTATLDGLTVARAFNSATGAAADGGGLRAESGTNMTLRNCRFIGHRSHDGGAIVVKSTVASPATLSVTDCIFEDNEANTGGGIRIEAGGRLTATGSRFESNRATFANCCGGGALMGVGNATLRVTNCTFERNSSARDGGAIFVEAGGTLTATGSTFRENTAPENRLGSAVYLASSNANRSRGTISRSSFFENVALGTSNGTVYASTGATLQVSSSVFVNNRMGSGAGVYSDGSNGTFINNTVYDNRDRSSTGAAVSLGGASSTWVVANNIIYGNTGEHQLNFGGATNKTMAHNLIQGGDDGIENGPTRTGPLTAPMFATELFASLTATDANYLRLIPGNAVGVDAGNNDYIDGDGSITYTAMQGTAIKGRAGANRVNNTTVDVGAFESAPSTVPFLRVLGMQGELLSTSGNDPLPAAAGTHALRVVYGGMGASSVSIAATTDAGNAVNSVTASVPSSPGEVELVVVANTTNSEKQVTLTFTLEGVTHDDVVITFSQRRGAVAVYVAADGSEAANGADWANATTVQAALDNYVFGDSLFLRAGVYTPTAKNSAGSTVTDAREATYVLPDGIKIYGGFVGTETEAAGREMSRIHSTNATIIEGDIGTMRTETDENNDDNVKRLLYLGAGDTATLDGLTVARAFNSATGAAADGGGLRAESGTNMTLRNCRFIGHRSHDGGAIVVKSTVASPATLMARDCIFEDNAANTGGGIRMEAGGMLTVANSEFESNRATFANCCGGGALMGVGNATLRVTNCTFERNSSAHSGGAIYVEAGGTLMTTGSTFMENTAANNRTGSAILLASTADDATTGTISRSSFFENAATGTSNGTVYAGTGATLEVSSSVFVNNKMERGAGVYSDGSNGIFINNTVYDNRDRSSTGAAVRLGGGSSTWVVANNIIYGNRGEHQLNFGGATNKTMAHNLIQGGDDGIENGPTRTGPLTAPMFAAELFASLTATDANYLRLIPGNAIGVDAGNNDYIDGDVSVSYTAMQGTAIKDRTGANRVNNTTVDVGAYESAPSTAPFLRVLGAQGELLSTSGNDPLPAAAGTHTLWVVYGGMGASSVSIAETTDADNALTSVTPSVSSSPGEAELVFVTNTMSSEKQVTLTFTLEGATHDDVVITLSQRRSAVAVYVAADGSGTASGADWANATTLQAALDNRDLVLHRDSLFLRAGVYTPTAKNSAGATVTDARDATYVLPDGIKIYGGFVGTETEAAGREMSRIHSTNATIIEGDIGTMRTATDKNNGDNVKRLLYLGAGDTATLDGLTVARAFNSETGAAEDGGGLRAESGSSVTLRNCRFIGHRSHDGGAIVVKSTEASPATLTVTDCIFEDNAANTGGGIRIEAGGRLTATGSRFESNRATHANCCGGGALMGVGNATLRVTNCTFERNSSAHSGGAIFVNAGSTFTATGNTFRENTAARNRFGSAILLSSTADDATTGTISRCSFFENVALGTSNGTVYAGTGATLEVSSSVFVNNRMGSGAGVYSDGSNGIFINNTVYDNRDRSSSSAAVSLGGASSTWVIANNIIYGNTGEHQLEFEVATNKTMAHNLIQGGDDGIENGPTYRTGSLTAPMFAGELFASLTATDASYLRLIPGNAVGVDAGANNYIDGDGSSIYTAMQGTAIKDRTGANRVNNTTVDVGAYESAPSTAPFLRLLGVQGEVLSTSGNDPLPAAAGTHTLRVVYGGMGASSVTIAETTDADNALTSVTPSVSSSSGEVELVLVANTTNREKQVTLTFTLEGATLDAVVITFTQRRTIRAVYVAPSSDGGDASATGLSWGTATTLQSALDSYYVGDLLYLKAGTYTPTAKDSEGATVTDARDATYVLPDSVVLYGGFAGTETGADLGAVLSARGMSLIHSTNATTIEGDIGTMRTEMDKNNDDNVKRLLYLGAGDTATLDGLTVARAFNSATGAVADGAGLRAGPESSVTLRNCRFIGHKGRNGGAIFMDSDETTTTLTLTDCIFEDNEANTGGALRMDGRVTLIATGSTFERNRAILGGTVGGGALLSVRGVTLTVRDCDFEDNEASTGGALRIEAGGRLTVTGSRFRGNRSIYSGDFGGGGAIIGEGGTTLTATGSTFEGNSTRSAGGAIHVRPGGTLTTTGSTFRENSTGDSKSGSAIYFQSSGANPSTGTISRCSFFENSGYGSNAGGTVYGGDGCRLYVSNSVFANNIITWGPAVTSFGDGTFINNTVYHNQDRLNGSGAVRFRSTTAVWVIANNIIYGNKTGHQVDFRSGSSLTMSNNLVEGNSVMNGPSRTGVIAPPDAASRIFLSTDPMHEDYLRLIPGNNVGVDAGANNYIDGNADAFEVADTMNLPDRAGDPRINNTTVDAGAYELDSEATALHVADALGNILHPSGKLNLLAAAGGTVTLRVFYAGTDATMGVTIAETTDEGNIISALTTSVPSSRSNATFTLAANTASSRRTATLTFTLTGVTPAVSLVIPFTQRRGTASAIYVTTSGSETANGTSWADAMDLHTALMDGISGDSIYVGAGSYTPTRLANGTTFVDPRDGVFGLPSGVTLYGGFAGTETGADLEAVLAARETSLIHSTYATIIEGDIGTMRTETETNNDDNIKRLLYLGAGGMTTLDGLTVARAFNSATGAAADGGGLRAESGSSVTLRNCRFIGHRSHDGGAIVVKSTEASPATLTVTDCIFEDNAANTGGGIRIEAGGRLIVTDSEFEGNRATFANCCGGGALMGVGNATLRVTNCTFERNSSAHSGGAIYVEAGGTLMTTESTFRENTAGNNRAGSTLYLASTADDATTGTISRCSFFENAAPGTSTGTVYANTHSTLHVSNSVFTGNTIGTSAALYSEATTGTFINNTVYDNRDRSSTGAAVRLGGGSSTWVVANNIIYGNTGTHQLRFTAGATNKTMAYNLIQGGNDGIENPPARTGPLTAPMFAAELFASLTATDANYLRLIPGNAVGVDAGNNDYIDGDVSVSYTAMQGTAIKDRTGANRVNNTTVDVGAYESAPSTAPFLRVLSMQGEILTTSGRTLLPAATEMRTLRVVYGGMDATSVTITETTDADNALTSVTPSVSSSPGEVELVFVANTTNREKPVTLTFTLGGGATLDPVMLTFAQSRGAAVAVYVAADGSEMASGLDWANATTLQAALDNYVFSGDSLFLKAGIYTPTAKNSDGNAVTDAREATYVLPDGIKIYGGFVGMETEAAGREMSLIHSTNATTIEGDIGTMRTETDKNNDDNIKRLLYLAAGDTATLDGLAVARAFNSATGAAADGGGLRAESGSSVTLRNCRFIGHKSHDGGAIAVKSTEAAPATLSVTDCDFEDNEANTGGGIRIEAGGTLTVTNSEFEGNRSIHANCCGGGAIMGVGNASIEVTGSTFERNSAARHAGAIFVDRGTLIATGSTFERNSSDFGGGAIYVSRGSTFTTTGGIFRENTTVENGGGSAIFLWSTDATPSTGTISRCSFFGNSAPGTSTGTVFTYGNATLHVSNSLFANNSMQRGAAVYIHQGGGGTFINNTLYGNTSRKDVTGAVVVDGAGIWVAANNVLYGNTVGMESQFELFFLNGPTNKTMVNNLIEGNSINNDPTRIGAITATAAASEVFASTTATDANYLRLASASVGVNAGNNDYIDGEADAYDAMADGSITDLLGNARISDRVVDVGAYEFYAARGIVFNPATPPVVAAGGDIVTLTVTFEGDATGFSFPMSGEGAPAGWLMVPTMVDAQNMLAITVEENMGAMARTSMVVFTPTGGAGTATPTTLTITQLGAAPRQTIVFDPATPADVAAAGATVPLTVTFEGGATGFTVPASGEGAPASWLTVPAAVTMADGQNQLAITVEENTGAMDRSSMIVFTPTGGEGGAFPTTLTITQLGTAPRQSIVFAPAMPADVVAGGGMVTLTVTFGGGATGFSVPASGEGAPASWLTVPPAVTMAGGQNQLAITVLANTDAMDRSSMIVFTPTGGAGTAIPTTLTLTQLGTAPRQSIVFDPVTPADVVAAGATVTLTVTFGGGATGFSVPASGEGAPASWLTVPPAVTMAGGQNQLAITVLANTDAMDRSSMIVFTPTGGAGTATPTTLTLTQLGTAPRQSIVFDPATPADVVAAGATVTLTVTFEGGATGFSVPASGEGAPASWLTVPTAVTMTDGQNQLAITVVANTDAMARSSMIVFTPTGGAGTATPATLTITQQGGVSFGVSGGVFADVRVVNPASDELVIYGLAKEVGLLLRDVSGREVFSGSLPLGGQRVSLPPLARGAYVLVLRDENGQTHNVRLLKE